jgi:hypothetical protein
MITQTVKVHLADEIYRKPNFYFMPVNETPLGCFYSRVLN